MEYDVWKTLFTKDLDNDKYLYHYTTVNNAIDILSSNCLKFHPINNYNNYVGTKVGIVCANSRTGVRLNKKEKEQQIQVKKYLHNNWNNLQMLCFSTDISISDSEINDFLTAHTSEDKDIYFDVTGRGFALPSMWSKFSSSNNGVCFIVNKKMFEENLRLKTPIFFGEEVKYFNFFQHHEINREQLAQLCRQISNFNNNFWTLENLMTNDEHYIKYNFFEKLDCCKHEHEYRYVVFNNLHQDVITVDKFSEYLDGIVIDGLSPELEEQLSNHINSACKIRRINFNDDYCRFY